MKAEIEHRRRPAVSDTADSQRHHRRAGSRTITWSADGIKRTIQNAIPLVGSFVNGVTTNPSDGTIELQGALGSIVAKPTVVDDGLALRCRS